MERNSSEDWDRLRRRIYKRDNWQCQSCGRMGYRNGNAQLHAHHIIPRSEGGRDEPTNLITLCDRCHAEYHENPYLLENGLPVTPTMFQGLTDLMLIDLLGIRGEESRRIPQKKSVENEKRVEWREEGLDALQKLYERRIGANDDSERPLKRGDVSPPRLYNTTSDGIVLRIINTILNEDGLYCPRCKSEDLTSDWIKWNYRGTAKRITCRSCDALIEEQVVKRNGRSLIDLEPVTSVFGIDTIRSPLIYQLKRPNLSLDEFLGRYETNCIECGESHCLHYHWIWSRSDLFPRRTWICHSCNAEFLEGDDALLCTHTQSDTETPSPSGAWYYTIVGLLLITFLAFFVSPLLVFVSGLPLALGIYKDIQYVRTNSSQHPVTPLWTWGTLVLGGGFAALAYLANRWYSDTPESNLHNGFLQRAVHGFASDRL